jgi:hypothetical protein
MEGPHHWAKRMVQILQGRTPSNILNEMKDGGSAILTYS